VLDAAGYRTFSDILDLEPDEVRAIPGMAPEMADRLLALIDELTTTDESAQSAEPAADLAAPAESVPPAGTAPAAPGEAPPAGDAESPA